MKNLPKQTLLKARNLLFGVVLFSAMSVRAANIDVGLTLGGAYANSTLLTGTLFQVGTFTGYNDGTGTAWFAGKDKNTLLSSWNVLTPIAGNLLDNSGQYYDTFDLGTLGVNTRLFAWIFDTNDSATSTQWAVLSGPVVDLNTVYDPVWKAVASTDLTVNVIEAITTHSVIYASNGGASISTTSPVAIPGGNAPGANLILVPEPSTASLLMIGAVGLAALRRLRRV